MGVKSMKKLDVIACLLLCLGGLNWGLMGLFDFNLIEYFIDRSWVYKTLYFLVGASAIYQAVGWKFIEKRSK